jgi:hypothetical protein
MEDSLYNGFVRRRRYLIAISLSVALVKYLGLTLPEIDVLGNKATVHHPERMFRLVMCSGSSPSGSMYSGSTTTGHG